MFIKPVYCTGKEYTGDRHYKWEECTGDRHYKWEECTDIIHTKPVHVYTGNVQGTDITHKPLYCTGTHQTSLQYMYTQEMYRDGT